MFFSYFQRRKLKRIGKIIADYIDNQAGQTLIQFTKEIDSDIRRPEDPSATIWILQAFGVHIVDHYSRNHLNEYDRINALLPSLLTSIHEQTLELMKYTIPNANAQHYEYWLINMNAILQRLETCNVIHSGNPANRDAQGVSLGVISIALLSNYVTDDDIPDNKFDNWEELQPDILELYDKIRFAAWDFHQAIKSRIYVELDNAGYKEIRNVGLQLQAPIE